MLEVSKKYKNIRCDDYPFCEMCPFQYIKCSEVFKNKAVYFKDLEFTNCVPEQIKNYVKEVLLDDTRKV